MVSPPSSRPAAISARSAGLLAEPAREAVVLGALRHALHLRVGASVLPVVAAGGLRLPTALWLAGPAPLGWGVQPGDRVRVGDGQVVLPGLTLRAVRVWTPERVRPLAAVPRLPAIPVDALREAGRGLTMLVLTGADLGVAVDSMVGAGPGLTPSGDDVLCGVLLALRLAGRIEAVDRLWGAVAPRVGATTSLSAALLREAADGYAVPPVVRLTAALAEEAESRVVEALVAQVRAVGHTSGADLLAGLAGALDALGRSPATPELSRQQGCAETGALIHHTDQCPRFATPLFSARLPPAGSARPAAEPVVPTVLGAP